MSDISVGAVGAAVVAGLVSLLGLVIGKEQKVSEFRQLWIDDLRKCLVSYLVSINAISDALRLKKIGSVAIGDDVLVTNYKILNESSYGITLRINPEEDKAIKLRATMLEFESLATENSGMTPDKIRDIEKRFIEASQELLKFEWRRVKRGEKAFVWTKRIVALLIIVMVCLFAYLWASRDMGHAPRGMNISNASLVERGVRPVAAGCGARAS